MAAPPSMNPAQARAVEHSEGPLLVLAGAGSGKTRVITHRIARLVERGVPAHAICALTFTNKAAGEMLERLEHLLRSKGHKVAASQLTVCTFHAFGLQVLSKEAKSSGGAFTIFDQGDCLSTVKDLLARIDAGRRLDAAAVLARISNAKNAFVSPDEFVVREGDDYDEVTSLVYPRYQAALRGFRAYDFDDLVCEVVRVFRAREDVLDRWQGRYRYVLVDEYQDTNRSQLELLKQLVAKHVNLCVVGDDDQSIYAWRGADVRNILEFDLQFPGAQVVKLEQNYRSRGPILAVANAVIGKRKSGARHTKVLFTDKAGGDVVQLGVAPHPDAEAAFVADAIAKAIHEEGRRPDEIAVLYRSNGQAKVVEAALREREVRYQMFGGQQFFERKEIKDALAYLKLALNRRDEISLRRIVNYPPRGIGEASLELLAANATSKKWSLWQAIERADAIEGLPQAARTACAELEAIVAEIRKGLVVDRKVGSEVAKTLVERAGFRADIDRTSPSPQAADRRWQNVEALFGMLGRREAKLRTAGKDDTNERDLGTFLHALTLQTSDDEEPQNQVTLSTLHGSKGLEFDLVFLLGCEEGYLPHSRTLDQKVSDPDSQDIEEERRLFYVGVTRAKERLVLSRCAQRLARGKPVPRTPSRFLDDIPPELVQTFVIPDPARTPAATGQANAANVLAMLDAFGD